MTFTLQGNKHRTIYFDPQPVPFRWSTNKKNIVKLLLADDVPETGYSASHIASELDLDLPNTLRALDSLTGAGVLVEQLQELLVQRDPDAEPYVQKRPHYSLT